jgi:hypothetical protein
MYSEQIKIALIAGIAVITLGINLPFGYLRSKVKKFSWKWFLYVHLSIPIVIVMRLSSHISYKFVPLFIAFAVFGQIFGGRMNTGGAG